VLPERDPALAEVYLELCRAEARHHGLFFRLARDEVGAEATEARAGELLDFEATLVTRLPLRAAVH
jgi:tRNA isopentenyl-2-thiomethyl-A-37 hydroxylase MiaE